MKRNADIGLFTNPSTFKTPRLSMFYQSIIALMLILAVPAGWAEESSSALENSHPSVLKADRLIVKKEARVLIVMRESRVLYRFNIALGGAPEGDKLEEGDWRTPEGRYIIDWRNPHSRFYKALHISYPSPLDKKASAAEGVDPGGMIMIHGYPPEAETNPEKYEGKDWTNGCIALNNEDMDILWESIDDGTPIEIYP